MLLLIDENTYRDTELPSLKNLVAAVFRFKHADNLAVMQDLISLLIDWLGDRPDLRRMFSLWLRATLMRKKNYAILLSQVDDLQKIKIMLSERLEQWALAYIAAGKEEGKQEVEMLALQKLLSKHFGAIPLT
jgi:hypothetical protein